MDTLEEDRVEAAVDSDYDVVYEGTAHTYTVPWHWGTGDFDDEYPVITVTYNSELEQRDEDTPMNDLIEIDERPGESQYDFHDGSRVRDVLQITVAHSAGWDTNGVPAHVVVSQIGKAVWKQFRFGLDLNTEGENGETEMVFDIAGSPSGPFRSEDTVRNAFTVAANYTVINTRTVDSVEQAESDVNT